MRIPKDGRGNPVCSVLCALLGENMSYACGYLVLNSGSFLSSLLSCLILSCESFGTLSEDMACIPPVSKKASLSLGDK